ncbi:GtrA family protein [Halogeometricum borinquense]|uniref:GtrA family protein n=1 Tax=Halogeometricum borinquense TaxID=60847 RepID=UPI0034354DEC
MKLLPQINLGALLSPKYFWRFLSVGALGAVIDNVTLAALVEFGLLGPVMGAVIAKEASITTMFLLNERWTFSGATAGRWWSILRRFICSNLVRAVGASVGIAVLAVLTQEFGLWYLFANVVGIGVGFVFNYIFESLLTWKVALGN